MNKLIKTGTAILGFILGAAFIGYILYIILRELWIQYWSIILLIIGIIALIGIGVIAFLIWKNKRE